MDKDDLVGRDDVCSRCPELLPYDALYLDNGERLCGACEGRALVTPTSLEKRLEEWAAQCDADGMAGTATLCRQSKSAIQSLQAENAALREGVVNELTEGSGIWLSCSGCHETNEGAETGFYPFNSIFQSYQGAGCRECGGLGVIWFIPPTEEECRTLLEKTNEAE